MNSEPGTSEHYYMFILQFQKHDILFTLWLYNITEHDVLATVEHAKETRCILPVLGRHTETGERWGAMEWLRSEQGGGAAPKTLLGVVTVRNRLKESTTFISWPSMRHLQEEISNTIHKQSHLEHFIQLKEGRQWIWLCKWHSPLESVGLGVADTVQVLSEARHQNRGKKSSLLQQQPEAALNRPTHYTLETLAITRGSR